MEKLKIVYYWDYCPKCMHRYREEDEEPCCYCLTEPVNVDSRKPTRFKEKDNG